MWLAACRELDFYWALNSTPARHAETITGRAGLPLP